MSLAAQIKWDAHGLVVAVAQDRLSGRVQMVAYMDQAALEKTLESKRATFFSRSRGVLWTKGETSGHFLQVHALFVDCDGDAVLLLVDPIGPSCHTGEDTCFFQRAEGGALAHRPVAVPPLDQLERDIEARKSSDAGKSYTRALLDGGPSKIGDKLREEADELARAIADESKERVASEAADVLYHLLVGLASRDVDVSAVLDELEKRRGVSGHQEKASRPR